MSETSRKILIAEDEGLLVLQLRALFESWGFEISACLAAAEDVVESARSAPPDLIVMDIGLARHTSGIEAARSIRGFSTVPIVLVTGYPEEQFAEETRKLAPARLLRKPVRIDDLHRAALEALEEA